MRIVNECFLKHFDTLFTLYSVEWLLMWMIINKYMNVILQVVAIFYSTYLSLEDCT
jgi:hypothetical protein